MVAYGSKNRRTHASPACCYDDGGRFPRPGWLADRTDSHITFRLEDALLQEALDVKNNYRRVAQQRRVPRGRQSKAPRPAILEDLRFARAHTARPIKIAVPGLSTVVDSTLDEAYGDEEALDVASALNLEPLDLQAAGCDVVQIDEPAMTRYHKKVTAYGLALSTVASKAFTYRLSCISATDIPAAASMSMNTPSSWRS
jgi:hypothetical protein